MPRRVILVLACSLSASCQDDAPVDDAGSESSSTTAPTGADTGSTTGSGPTSADGTGTSTSGTTMVLETSGTMTSGSTTGTGTGTTTGSSSSGGTSSSGGASTEESGSGSTGDPPPPACMPGPPGNPMCGDGMPVGGELCYQLMPPLQGVGTFAGDVWAGDLDGDMDADALVLVDFPAAMSVLLGDGMGNLALDFSHPLAGVANTGGVEVAVGDMDGNGTADAVVAFDSPPGLRVLLGDGLGGFAPPQVFPLGDAPAAVTVADFDSDGNQDAIVADAISMTIYYGLGNGSFGLAVSYIDPALTSGRAVGTADFDGDGVLDIAVAFSQTVAVYLGDGIGRFVAPFTIAVPVSMFGPQDLAIGDVNDDGVPDVLVADNQQNEVHELHGVGDGTFILVPAPHSGSFVELGEGNSDCQLDIYSRTTPLMFDELTVYPSDGMGDHMAGQTFMLHSGMSDMATADFNGDALSDVLFAIGPTGNVGVSLSQP